jgi:hypothetical protein
MTAGLVIFDPRPPDPRGGSIFSYDRYLAEAEAIRKSVFDLLFSTTDLSA